MILAQVLENEMKSSHSLQNKSSQHKAGFLSVSVPVDCKVNLWYPCQWKCNCITLAGNASQPCTALYKTKALTHYKTKALSTRQASCQFQWQFIAKWTYGTHASENVIAAYLLILQHLLTASHKAEFWPDHKPQEKTVEEQKKMEDCWKPTIPR